MAPPPTDTSLLLEASADDRYRLLVDCVEDYAIYMLNCAGEVVTWNRGAERIKGYSRREIQGRHFRTFFPPEDAAANVPGTLLAEACRNTKCVGEGWRVRKDGERFWSSFTITAMRDGNGNLIGFAKIARDLSERKRMEEELRAMVAQMRQERDRLYAVTESSMDSVYICEAVRDADGTIEDFVFTYLNRNVEKMVSLPRSVMLGGKMCELLPVNRELGLFDRYKRVVETGEPLVYEFEIHDRDVISGWIRVQAVKLHDGIVVTASDISERKRDEQRMRHVAHHDQLTGLLNRNMLEERIGQAVERARRYGSRAGVFLIDLDGFKQINDSLGHAAGDELLVAVAGRLKSAIRATDSALRIGGDEFVLVMGEIRNPEDIRLCAEKIRGAMTPPLQLGAGTVNISCSIGIAVYPECPGTTDELLLYADAAMYAAKRRGKNQFEVFAP